MASAILSGISKRLPALWQRLERLEAQAQTQAAPSPFPRLGISLSAIEEFVAENGGEEKLKGMTTTDVCMDIVLPATSSGKTSYCELLLGRASGGHPGVGEATVFISHAWKYEFVSVVNALRSHFRDRPNRHFLWFDVMTNNQHLSPQRPFDWCKWPD